MVGWLVALETATILALGAFIGWDEPNDELADFLAGVALPGVEGGEWEGYRGGC